MFDIVCSLVTYREDIEKIRKTITGCCNTNLNIKLYLIDNSPDKSLGVLSKEYNNLEYIFKNGYLKNKTTETERVVPEYILFIFTFLD